MKPRLHQEIGNPEESSPESGITDWKECFYDKTARGVMITFYSKSNPHYRKYQEWKKGEDGLLHFLCEGLLAMGTKYVPPPKLPSFTKEERKILPDLVTALLENLKEAIGTKGAWKKSLTKTKKEYPEVRALLWAEVEMQALDSLGLSSGSL